MLERIWSGWRAAYVGGDRPAPGSTEASPFTQILESGESDEATHIVHRGERVFAIMNIHPYTTGHLLVLPYREVADLADLTADETAELWSTVTDGVAARAGCLRPGRPERRAEPRSSGRWLGAVASPRARRAALDRRQQLHVRNRQHPDASRSRSPQVPSDSAPPGPPRTAKRCAGDWRPSVVACRR